MTLDELRTELKIIQGGAIPANPREWSPETVRDALAVLSGKYKYDGAWQAMDGTGTYFVGSRYGEHPIPDTLDCAAAMLPEGYKYTCCSITHYAKRTSQDDWSLITIPRRYSERNDRFMLALLCRIAELPKEQA